MKWDRLKRLSRFDGSLRANLEPIKPSPGCPRGNQGYAFRINGNKYCSMCYCRPRYDWLIRSLVGHGVSAEHFAQAEIPEEKCQEIAAMLKKILKAWDFEDNFCEPDIINTDIAFWSHCGGVRIHDWITYQELHKAVYG
jgi:hypothetical protein